MVLYFYLYIVLSVLNLLNSNVRTRKRLETFPASLLTRLQPGAYPDCLVIGSETVGGSALVYSLESNLLSLRNFKLVSISFSNLK